MIHWTDCPGRAAEMGCCPVVQGSAQTYLTCPCSLGWGCRGCVLLPHAHPHCFLSYFCESFFIFIVWQHQAPSTADSQWYQNCTCIFSICITLHCCKRKLCPVPSVPVPSSCQSLCVFVLLGHLCDCTGRWTGDMTLLLGV